MGKSTHAYHTETPPTVQHAYTLVADLPYVYGISNKVLSERLKMLEADGYISRQMFPEVPIRVEYSLTNFGHSYLQKLLELAEWAEKHKGTVMANRQGHKRH